MSFNDYHKTVDDSSESYIFQISIGNSTFLYTSSEMNIVVGGNMYLSRSGLKSTELSNSGESERNNVNIELPIDDDIAQYLLRFIPSNEITLRISSIEIADPDREVIHQWTGIYVSYEANYPIFRMTFATFDQELSKDALATSFGVNCNWSQYDDNCKLNPNAHAATGTITAVTGLLIDSDFINDSITEEHYIGGYIELDGRFGAERAWIIGRDSSTSLILDRSLESLQVGAAFSIVPSCRGDFDRCNAIFNNKINFFGGNYANKINMFQTDVRRN